MADSATATPPKRGLPFKRTLARRKSPNPLADSAPKPKKDDDDDGVGMFQRVEEEFAQLAEERERKLRRKEKRDSAAKEAKATRGEHDIKRRKLSMDSEAQKQVTTPVSARRSASITRGSVPSSSSNPNPPPANLEEDDDVIMDVKGKGKEILSPKELRRLGVAPPVSPPVIPLDSDDEVPTPSPTRRLNFNHTSGGRCRTPSKQPAIPIQSEHEDMSSHFTEALPPEHQNPIVIPEDDDDLEDDLPPTDPEPPDELQEYVQRARERAERERSAKLKLSTPATPGSNATPASGQDSDAPNSNPIAMLMVTSQLPNARPVVARRYFNQTMRVVLQAWILRQQPAPTGREREFFLTWKGNRIYDSTTIASLGFDPQDLEEAQNAGCEDGRGFHRGKLHLEVWTEASYEEFLKRREKERLRALGLLDDEEEEDYGTTQDGGGSQDVPEKEEATTKVILKGKDYEPLKMRVYATTTVDEMVSKFRGVREVPDDKDVSIFFDGDRLEGDMAVQDTEIEDMDVLEVHVR